MQEEKMQVVGIKLSDNGTVHRSRFYLYFYCFST